MKEKICMHACYIYDNDSQRDKEIGKYLEAGFNKGEKVSYCADEKCLEEIKDWLINMGVTIPKGDKAEQFVITKSQDTYYPNKKFIPNERLNNIRTFYQKVFNEGYKGIRISCEMSWALKGVLGSERLLEFEALVNEVLQNHPITTACQYDARRFDGSAILNVLKVHPYIFVHGQIIQNPYYMNPQEYLRASMAKNNLSKAVNS